MYDDVAGKIDVELARLREVLGKDLTEFNRMVREKEIPAVVVKPPKKDKGAAEGPASPDEPDHDR